MAADPSEGWPQARSIPQRVHGETMLPQVSVPMANPTRPAAVEAADPADEPLDPCSGFHGVARHLVEPDVAPRQRADRQLRQQRGPGLAQSRRHRRGLVADLVLERLGPPGRPVSGNGQQVLGTPRDAVQRPAVAPGSDLAVGQIGLLQRQITGHGNHAVQHRIVPLETLQVEPRKLHRAHLPTTKQHRQLADRSERKILNRIGTNRPRVPRHRIRGQVFSLISSDFRPPGRRLEEQRRRNLVPDRKRSQLGELPPRLAKVLEHQLALGVGKLHARDPLRVPDHLAGNRRTALGHRSQRTNECSRPHPRGRDRFQHFSSRPSPPRSPFSARLLVHGPLLLKTRKHTARTLGPDPAWGAGADTHPLPAVL